MDKLNKIRLLAGLTIDPKTMISEARHVPTNKRDLMPASEENHSRRVDAVTRAVDHLNSAIQALESIPAIDFGGEIPHYISSIEEVISADNGEAGLSTLVKHYSDSHKKFKSKEASRVRMEQEEEDISSSAKDAVDHHESNESRVDDMPSFEKGQKAMLHGKPVVVVAAKEGSESVGVVPEGSEDDMSQLQLVHATELEAADDESADEIPTDDSSEDMNADLDGEELDDQGDVEDVDGMDDDEDLDSDSEDDDDGDEDDIEISALSIDPSHVPSSEDHQRRMTMGESLAQGSWIKTKDGQGGVVVRIEGANVHYRPHNLPQKTVVTPMSNIVTEAGTNFYYDVDTAGEPRSVKDGLKNANTVWKQVTAADAKNENPNQLNSVGAASSDETEKKVRVPASIKALLKTAMKEVEDGFVRLGSTESDAHFFYNNLLNAYATLLAHLEAGTVYEIKMAQIFMSSLMGPILFKIPAEVKNFIFKGGETRSLKDYMKPVDMSKYPITGPRNVLK